MALIETPWTIANRLLAAGQVLLLAAVIAVAAATTGDRDWTPAILFACLLVLAPANRLLSPGTGMLGPTVSATTLAMVLLGPGPAAVTAAVGVLAWSVPLRVPWPQVLDATVAHAASAVAGALVFRALSDVATGWQTVPVVCLIHLLAGGCGLVLAAGAAQIREREPVMRAAGAVFAGALPLEILTGLVTGAAVVAYARFGVIAVVALAPAAWAVRQLVASAAGLAREREDLRAQVDEFRALHVGAISVLVESMGMRHRVTARHSAAVARLARATAAAAGLSTRDQELVHTAGLVHDVGKFTFPDHTLTGGRLTEEDWERIRLHPQRGAELVGRVHGFEDVAEIVLCSHERVDGRGYPRGLAGERIPELARVLAIADCFHAMTAHDSYRPPRSFGDALVELRRVAGSQLDLRLVEVFVGVVASAGVDLDPAEDIPGVRAARR